MTYDQPTLTSTEAEQAVLGALLIDPGAIVRVAVILAPEDFGRPSHQHLFRAILGLYGRRQEVDYVSVVAELERDGKLEDVGGPGYLTELIDRTPVALHVETYATIVERKAIQRRLVSATGQMAQLAYADESETIEETIDGIEAVLFQAVQSRRSTELVPIKVPLEAYLDRIEAYWDHRAEHLGTYLGFSQLDQMLGGLQASDLVIIAGRPGMGKTSWLLSVAEHLASNAGGDKAVAVFSLEMSAEQLAQRLISSETGIAANRLRTGDIDDSEIELVMRAIAKLSAMPLYIDDTPGITPFELRTKVRRLNSERPIDLVMVDYLQLMQVGRRVENRVQEISLISRALKGLARELKMPVIAASQLSRAVESRAEKRPQLSDLRESGSIEQDSDIVLFLYRESHYEPDSERGNLTEVIVAKHRHGPTGSVDLVFVPEQTRFASPAFEGGTGGGGQGYRGGRDGRAGSAGASSAGASGAGAGGGQRDGRRHDAGHRPGSGGRREGPERERLEASPVRAGAEGRATAPLEGAGRDAQPSGVPSKDTPPADTVPW